MTAAVPHLEPTRALRAADARSGKTPAAASCLHCGQPCIGAQLPSEEKPFCCLGCQTVHALLTENGLGQFYELNATPGSKALAFETDHWPMVRQPQAFNQALLQWLDQQPD